MIGVNGLVGNLGIASGSSVSVLLATRYGWQMAYIVPGVDLPDRGGAVRAVSSRRKRRRRPSAGAKMLDLPPNIMARVFFIMTCAAVSGSIVFNFTTNGNGEMLKARIAELAANPWLLSMALFGDLLGSLADAARGRRADRSLSAEEHLPADPALPGAAVPARRAGRWLGAGRRHDAVHGVRVRRHPVHRCDDRALHRRSPAQPRHRHAPRHRLRRQLAGDGGASGRRSRRRAFRLC